MYLPAIFHPKLSKLREFYRLLAVFDLDYSAKIVKKPNTFEVNYRHLIQAYPHTGNNLVFSNLLSSNSYLLTIWDALKEFGLGKRATRPVVFSQFQQSIINMKTQLLTLNDFKMEDLVNNTTANKIIPIIQSVFSGLSITQTNYKLVYHSKALHFLLPDLIMPVDGAIVMEKGFGSANIPISQTTQFYRLLAVFRYYIGLTKSLGLASNGWSGNYWNRSVPKRIDNVVWVL